MRDPRPIKAPTESDGSRERTEELSAAEIAAQEARGFAWSVGTGDLLAGRYLLEDELGRGALSRVFRAHDRATRTEVAVKLVIGPGPGGRDWLERLGRELRLARQVRHPHVCEVFDLMEANGRLFLTMPLATGGTLRDTLRRSAERGWAERLADVRDVVSGLAAMHAAGVVHRDVKPENVLRMADGRLAISDFGLAVPLERTTAMTLGVGTPVYMAPELLLGASASARSDVWSLGVLMHETLFGVRPAESPPTASGSVGRPPERRQRRALRELCSWCLHQDPARRPADAREVQRTFQRIERGGRFPLRLGKLRPSRGIVLAAGAAVVAMSVAAAAWWYRRPIRELTLQGVPLSLAARAREISVLPGRVHCLSALPDGSLGVIWGEPRRALRLHPTSGAQHPWDIPQESYALPPSAFPDPLTNNCPQLASDGKRLLFTGTTSAGQRGAFLQELPGGTAVYLTAGEMPVWHPAGELLALKVDGSHPGILNLTTRQMGVLPLPRQATAQMILELRFGSDGRHLLVRTSDSTAGYGITRYDLDNFRVSEQLVVRGEDRDALMRVQLGAGDARSLLVHATMPGGVLGVARLDWGAKSIRWVGELAPFDLASSVVTGGAGLMMVGRRWTSELQVLREGQTTRTLATNWRAFLGHATAKGDVVVQAEHEGRVKVIVYPAGSDAPRVVGNGPIDGSPSFTPDGTGVVFTRGDASRSRDRITFCGLAPPGDCQDLIVVPTADFPTLSPRRDEVAYVVWAPYPHVAMASVPSGRTRVLSSSLACPPRWSGEHLWVARGTSDRFDWVELHARTGQASGRKIAGVAPCGAAEPGPNDIFLERLRIVHHETSRFLAISGLL